MRAIYRIPRPNYPWPIKANAKGEGAEQYPPNAREIGGNTANVIVHSAVYPNEAIEALTGATLMGHTYAEAMPGLTKGQRESVLEDQWPGKDADGNTIQIRGKQGKRKVGSEGLKLIPHSWGRKESAQEQRDMDAS